MSRARFAVRFREITGENSSMWLTTLAMAAPVRSRLFLSANWVVRQPNGLKQRKK